MPLYLDEDQVGTDPNVLGYPHLVLCMGVTLVMDDGHLIGAHVSDRDTEAAVLATLGQAVANHGGAMRQLYCCGHFAKHVTNHGCLDVAGKAAALNFHGPAYAFDTAFIDPRDGTFVELTSRGPANRCVVRYKRNEKMAYALGAGGGGAATLTRVNPFSGAVRRGPAMFVKTVAAPRAKTVFGRPIGHHTVNVADHVFHIQAHQIP